MEFQSLPLSDLQQKLEETTKANQFLMKENAVFQQYLDRHISPEDAEEWAEDDGRRGRKGKGARRLKVTHLTLDQKLDIATAELDAAKKEGAAVESNAVRTIDTLKAVLEQTDLRIADLKREAYEFKRDVVIGGEDPRTGRVMAERYAKYIEDQLKAKDSKIDKLRLKVQVLRAAQSKAETALKQKEDVGDVLHYIDFHQLQIENKQYLSRIEEKNAELLRLKLTTGNTVQILNGLKSKLAEVTREISRLKSEIRSRSHLLGRVAHDNELTSKNLEKTKAANLTLARGIRESEDMPVIMDYVALKAIQAELERDVTSWRRKVEITSLAARNAAAKTSNQYNSRPPIMGQTIRVTTATLRGVAGFSSAISLSAPRSTTAALSSHIHRVPGMLKLGSPATRQTAKRVSVE